MKFISWNTNGLRACVQKGFGEYFLNACADIFAIQETKLQEGQIELPFEGYFQYLNSAEKKGYSGTMIYTKQKPLNAYKNFDAWRAIDKDIVIPDGFENEGRILTLEFENFYFTDVYVPNSKRELLRLEYRMEWEDLFRSYQMELDKVKPVVICGDMNVAHKEIDLKNPKTNRRNAGFTDEEREKMTLLLESGFVDSFRYLYPDKTEEYSWWSYMGNARSKNIGWRIDYFIISERLTPLLKEAFISQEIMGSDHCPVGVVLDV